MRTVYERDVNGKQWPVRVPETEEERRKMQADAAKAAGGIDSRDEWDDDDEDWSDD